MSTRTVVTIEPSIGDTVTMRLFKAPGMIPDAWIPQSFDCDPDKLPPWSQPDAVLTHGQTIFARLTRHNAIRMALQQALQAPPNQQVHSLYFKLDINDAERLCWETLCDPQGRFLALDRRWPIARMADSVVDRPVKARDFSPPLKVMAFISALRVAGRPEWIALRDAVRAGQDTGLAIQLMIYAGEQALLGDIQADIQNLGLTSVVVQPVPDRTLDIEAAMEEFSPHILHFFCHGSTAHGVYELELATLLDWLQQSSSGSVRLQVDQFVNIPAIDNVWLVTLNCCEGGRSTGDFHSMAHSLVGYGIPAVIGSLEPVDAADAHEFCARLYPTIFETVRGKLSSMQTGETVELEWAQTLRPSRIGLCERHNNNSSNARQWALPVLYVRPEPFNLRKLVPGIESDALAQMRVRAEAVAGVLRALPPDAPEQVRTDLLVLLQGFLPSLMPDRLGNFIQGGA